MHPRTWTFDQLRDVAPTARSMAEIMRRLGLATSGGSYPGIRNHLTRLGIRTPLIDGTAAGDHGRMTDIEWIATNLVAGRDVRGPVTRRRLVRAGLWKDQCHIEGCGISKWMGKPAPLQVEHRDGNHFNNVFENLVLLCANCHGLTPTWGRKRRF